METQEKILFEIRLEGIKCRPKKNNMQPVRRGNRTFLVQNKRYQEFSAEFEFYILQQKDKVPPQPINSKVNVQMVIGRSDHRRTDLVNNMNAILDKLVDVKVLEDDNYNIVSTMDGSTMEYSKTDYIYIKITARD